MTGLGLLIVGGLALLPISIFQTGKTLAVILDFVIGIGLLGLGMLLAILGMVSSSFIGIYHWRCRKIWKNLFDGCDSDLFKSLVDSYDLDMLRSPGRRDLAAKWLTAAENKFLDLCDRQKSVQFAYLIKLNKGRIDKKLLTEADQIALDWIALKIRRARKDFKTLWIFALMLNHAPAKTPGEFLNKIKKEREATKKALTPDHLPMPWVYDQQVRKSTREPW